MPLRASLEIDLCCPQHRGFDPEQGYGAVKKACPFCDEMVRMRHVVETLRRDVRLFNEKKAERKQRRAA